MRRTPVRLFATSRRRYVSSARQTEKPPLISIQEATFYRQHPSNTHTTATGEHAPVPPLFPQLDFSLPSFSDPTQHWSILSTSSSARTSFLQILRGQYLAFPPAARSYPYLATPEISTKGQHLRSAQHAIQYVGFDAERSGFGGTSTQGSHLSARYESHRDETDFSLMDYLKGNTELNASEDETLVRHPQQGLIDQVIGYLRLEKLVNMPVSNLSNGQTRRARIARALLSKPECLLLDGPFMGLDPPTVKHLSDLLHQLAEQSNPRLILSLKPEDPIPDWVTHLAFLVEQRPDTPAKELGQRFRGGKKPRNPSGSSEFDQTQQQAELVASEYAVHSQGARSDVFQAIANDYATISHLPTRHFNFVATRRAPMWPNWESLRDAGRQLSAQGLLPEPRFEDGNQSRRHWHELEAPNLTQSVDAIPAKFVHSPKVGEPVVEMNGVQIRYGDRCVLGDWNDQPSPKMTDEHIESPGLHWTVRQGQRWGIFGPNGSGKTTLLAILTSDHPQSYSQPLKMFGRSRLPKPGAPALTLWDIQARLGHSSPEVHSFFPRNLSVRRTIESAWADTPLTTPKLSLEIDQKVDAALRWFQVDLMPSLGLTELQRNESLRFQDGLDPWAKGQKMVDTNRKTRLKELIEAHENQDIHTGLGLEWADDTRFGEVGFSAQRVLLFIRAVIRNPPLLILDEAFSGMDDSARDKCLLFLSHGERLTRRLIEPDCKAPINGKGATPAARGYHISESDISRLGRVRLKGLQDDQALLVVSHNPAEVPGCVREWICLPEAGAGNPRFGVLDGPVSIGKGRWESIWGM